MVQVGEEGDLLSDLLVGIEQVLGLFGELQQLTDGAVVQEVAHVLKKHLHRHILLYAILVGRSNGEVSGREGVMGR